VTTTITEEEKEDEYGPKLTKMLSATLFKLTEEWDDIMYNTDSNYLPVSDEYKRHI
jgi:hypothetical protein